MNMKIQIVIRENCSICAQPLRIKYNISKTKYIPSFDQYWKFNLLSCLLNSMRIFAIFAKCLISLSTLHMQYNNMKSYQSETI